MQRTQKILKVLILFFSLGIVTSGTLTSKKILAQGVPPKTVSAPVAAAPIIVAQPTSTPAPPSPRIRMLFTGDINLGRCIAKRTLSTQPYTNNYNYPVEFVADELRAADITVGSLDGSLSDESSPMSCPDSMNLIGPPKMVEALQFSGFDVITIATNHIKDCGIKGFDCNSKSLMDTVNTLKSAEIQPVGAGNTLQESRQPVIVERNGVRFAFLGINQINEKVWATETTPGTAPLSQAYIEKIKTEITSAKQIADVVIVMPHWGVENFAASVDFQRDWAHEFVNAGASLVIGNHPHIIQPMEIFSDKLIFYALGNFIFDQKHGFQRESIVVEVDFVGAEIESWQLHPISINYYTLQPHWADGMEAENILARAEGK
jgi:poly-gamma-glutamate capsule biosynthesis protein CapA/YwtB (metallophosphatase superfamily)